jgi:hypothetical protein
MGDPHPKDGMLEHRRPSQRTSGHGWAKSPALLTNSTEVKANDRRAAYLLSRKTSGSAGGSGDSASATLTRLLARSSKNSVVAKRTADRTAKINNAISEAIDSPDHDCD